MKKITAFLIAFALIFALCGCDMQPQNKTQNSQADIEKQYYDFSQQSVEKGDFESAVKALEEGIEKTGSEKLKKELESVKKQQEDAEKEKEEAAAQEAAKDKSKVLIGTRWYAYPYGSFEKMQIIFDTESVIKIDYKGNGFFSNYTCKIENDTLSLDYSDGYGFCDNYSIKFLSESGQENFGNPGDVLVLSGNGVLNNQWTFDGKKE